MENVSVHQVRVHIDQHPYHSPNPTTGAALYALGKVQPHHELFREVEGNREDIALPNNDAAIHLHQDEHFHSGEARPHEVKVEFEDVNSVETVDFRTSPETKLNEAWDDAAQKLGEPRKPNDRLQTPAGTDLMPYLALTLHELRERKIVHAFQFQIVGPTGGP